MNHIDFVNRRIALFGDASSCRIFYLQFCSMLDIKYFFANDTGAFLDDIDEVQCMPFRQALVKEEHLLIVLCCKHDSRRGWDTFLFNKGNEWGKDYIDSLYVVQYYRQTDPVVLEEKNIWIFGAGNNGRDFYKIYQEQYHICGFISNLEDEKECMGLPVIRPSDIMKQENVYIIICSRQDALMASQLREMGFAGNKNFGYAQLLPKKLFIAVGTCQIVRISRILQQNPHFKRCYDLCIYFDSMYSPALDADNRRLKGYGSFCDVIFYHVANVGTTEQRDYSSLVSQYYEKAMKLFMPFYYFRGQLMQTVESENDYKVRTSLYYLWLRGDKEVNRMIEDGDTEEEILKRVTGDYWPEGEILNNFRREMKKVEILDRFSTFSLKPFIEKNYHDVLIFSDGTHFGYQLELYLANEVAGYIGLNPISDVDTLRELESLSKSVMPVYPCVRKALGLTMADKYRFYNESTHKCEDIEFEEYIKRYVGYVSRIREISEKYGTSF